MGVGSEHCRPLSLYRRPYRVPSGSSKERPHSLVLLECDWFQSGSRGGAKHSVWFLPRVLSFVLRSSCLGMAPPVDDQCRFTSSPLSVLCRSCRPDPPGERPPLGRSALIGESGLTQTHSFPPVGPGAQGKPTLPPGQQTDSWEVALLSSQIDSVVFIPGGIN